MTEIQVGDVVFHTTINTYCNVTEIVGSQIWGYWYHKGEKPSTYLQYSSDVGQFKIISTRNPTISFFLSEE